MRINEATLSLSDFDPGEPGVPVAEDPWLACTVMPIQLLNRALQADRSDRRLALFWPGATAGLGG